MSSTSPAETRFRRWLNAPPGTPLAAMWSDPEAPAPFATFYTAVLSHLRIHAGEALAAVERVPPADRRRMDARERARLVRLRAHALQVAGRFSEANQGYERAWRAFEALGDRAELALTGIGWIGPLGQMARYEEAHRVAQRARRLLPPRDRVRRARLDSNHGNILFFSGRHAAATDRYRIARRSLRALGYENDAAMVTNNLGHALLLQGKVGPARRCFVEVEELCRKRELTSLGLYARAALATVGMMEGAWHESMQALDAVLVELEEQGDMRAAAHVYKQQAEFLLALGALEKAESLAARAYAAYRDLELRADAAQTASLHARILGALGRNIDARVRLDAALEHWTANRDLRARRRTEVEFAAVLLARGDATPALRLLRRATPYLVRTDRRGAGVRARHLLAEASLRANRVAYAARHAREAYRDATLYPGRLARPWIALTLAECHAARSDRKETRRWARLAVREMERLYVSLGTQAMRGQLSASRNRIYRGVVELILSQRGDDAPRTALDLLSRARSPQLIEDLLRGPRGMSAPLRAAIARLRDDLLGTVETGPGEGRSPHLRGQMKSLERDLARALSNPPAIVHRAFEARGYPTWSRRLDGAQLVFYDQAELSWSAYVVRRDRRVEYVPLPEAGRVLDEVWTPLRMLFEQAAHLPARRRRSFLSRTEAEAAEAMVELRTALWDPLRLDRGEVVLVPSGPLHGVPLEGLSHAGAGGNGGLWTVSRIPHPAVLLDERGRAHPTASSRNRRALLLDDASKGTRRETDLVANLLRREGISTHRTHRRRDLERARGRFSVLHVAAHGVYTRDQWLLNGIRLEDGWMGFEQLRHRRFRDTLMVFESCESGLPGERGGSELGGWLSAGLGAGGRELVLALWKIDDKAAHAFARAFYPRWCEGSGVVRAAGEAREEMRRRHPHPFSWASFLTAGRMPRKRSRPEPS